MGFFQKLAHFVSPINATEVVAQPKENVVSDEVVTYTRNADGSFSPVGTTSVPPAVLAEDTLEMRLAAADAVARGVTIEQADVVNLTTPTENRVGNYDRRVANQFTALTVVPAERRSGAYDRRVANPSTVAPATGA